jgi:hypothetical protein
MNEPPLEVVDFREPRRNQSQVERELCPHVRHVCEQYNAQADVFSKIVIPYTDDGPTGLGRVIEQKLLNKGMSFADVKAISVSDLSEAKRTHTEHNKAERFRNPNFGIGYKFGLGYVPSAIEKRGEAEKAQQHKSRVSEHAQQEASKKREEDQRVREQIAKRRELWDKLPDFEKRALLDEARKESNLAVEMRAKNALWKKVMGE